MIDFAVGDDRLNWPDAERAYAVGVARIRLDATAVQTLLGILSRQLSELEGYSAPPG